MARRGKSRKDIARATHGHRDALQVELDFLPVLCKIPLPDPTQLRSHGVGIGDRVRCDRNERSTGEIFLQSFVRERREKDLS